MVVSRRSSTTDKRSLPVPPLLLPLLIGGVSLAAFLGMPEELLELPGGAEGLFWSRPWSLLSYAFVHRTPLHLLFSLVLLSAGLRLTRPLGGKALWALFLSGVVLGGVSYLALSALAGSPGGNLVGASAGVCALMPVAVYRGMRSGRGIDSVLSLLLAAAAAGDALLFVLDGAPGFLSHIGGYLAGGAALGVILHRDRQSALRERAKEETLRKARLSGVGALSERERRLLLV